MVGPEEYSRKDIIANTKDLSRLLRVAKKQALKKGNRDSIDVTQSMFEHVRKVRSPINDFTVLWMLCLKYAGNSREAAPDDDFDELYQGLLFDRGDYPIQRLGDPEVVIDGKVVALFHRNTGKWVEVKPDGKEVPAKPERIAAYKTLARTPHLATDIVPVREFTVEDGDQRTQQMIDNLGRADAALARWRRGWALIRPLLEEHDGWMLGRAVDDLRDRDEWPADLDD
jgi:hypothetical protein